MTVQQGGMDAMETMLCSFDITLGLYWDIDQLVPNCHLSTGFNLYLPLGISPGH
jgi:hypothetical protein